MTRYGLLAVVPALALCSPAFAEPQLAAAAPPGMTQAPPVAVHTDPATGAVVETITLPPGTHTPPNGEGGGAVEMVSTPPFEWVSGHYNWDPDENQYVWMVGQYLQLPRQHARWIAGNWRTQPNGLNVWAAGHFE